MIRNFVENVGVWRITLSINEQVAPSVKTLSVVCIDEGLKLRNTATTKFANFSYSWTAHANSLTQYMFSAASAQQIQWANVTRYNRSGTTLTITPVEAMISELVACTSGL